jgi:hypothetical protein
MVSESCMLRSGSVSTTMGRCCATAPTAFHRTDHAMRRPRLCTMRWQDYRTLEGSIKAAVYAIPDKSCPARAHEMRGPTPAARSFVAATRNSFKARTRRPTIAHPVPARSGLDSVIPTMTLPRRRSERANRLSILSAMTPTSRYTFACKIIST